MAKPTPTPPAEAARLKAMIARLLPKVKDKAALDFPLEPKRLAAYLTAQGCVVGEAHNYPEGIKIKVTSGGTRPREESFQSPSLAESLLMAIEWFHR